MSLIQNVVRSYQEFTLEIPKFEIADQGITVLRGDSGSGKSTFLRILMGLEKCPGMSWVLNGMDLAKLPAPKRRVGVVFQSLELFPHMTALENIFFHAQARGISKADFEARMKPFFQISKMEPHLHKKVNLLSGGEQQRTALLRALAGKPQILLLDEPFSSLDPDLKKDLKSLLVSLLKTENIPCLMVSHDPEDEKLATKIQTLTQGKLL